MARQSLKSICKLIDSVNERLSPEVDFLEDLKRSIELTANSSNGKPSKTYKPSSMKCIRNMYYQVSGEEVDPSDTSYTLVGICDSGSDIHIRVQKHIEDMKKNGIDCEYIDVGEFVKSRNLDYLEILSKNGMETKLHHKILNITFMCDGIIRYKGHYYILEIKTANSYKWSTARDVLEEHKNQGISYSSSFGIDDVIYLYVSRDNLDMKAFMFHVTDDMKQELVGKIELCNEYVNKKVAPPRPLDLPKSTCNYCPYKSKCERDGNE